MKQRFGIAVVLAIGATSAAGMWQPALADGIGCKRADKQAGYVVCARRSDPGQVIVVRAGDPGVSADILTYDFQPQYTYTRTEYHLTADTTGATLEEDHYDSDYYSEVQSSNTKHVGLDGYHEHEDNSFYGYYSTTGTFDRSITTAGYDETTTQNGSCTGHTAYKTDLTIETDCP